MSNDSKDKKSQDLKPDEEKPSVTLFGTVEKVIPPTHSSESEKAEIAIHDADHLYREIRVINTLRDGNGKEVALKQGAEVEVIIEADSSATVPQKPMVSDSFWEDYLGKP